MKALLIAVNAKYIHSNLAVYSLKASAGAYKDQVEILETTINQSREEILREIYRRKPDVAAFSCYIWNIQYVKDLLYEAALVLPDTQFFAGGPEVSYCAEAFLRENPMVKGVLIGEGETTFRELLEHYEEGRPLESIKGLVYRDDGEKGTDASTPEIRNNGFREFEDLDQLPFMYQDLEGFEHRIIYYESSRGCPFSCSYCLSSIERRVRFRNLKLVKEELQFFLDQKVPQIKFVDRTFNCNHKRTMELLQFLKEHDNGVTNFHFEISADLLQEDEIALMRTFRPGLVQLEIGVQSTNPETLKSIHRHGNVSAIAEKVEEVAKSHNIHQHLDLIAGLPCEGLESFRKSFNDVYRMRPQQLQLGFLKVLKGSEMERRAKEFGIVYRKTPPYEVLFTKWLSYGELLELKKIEEMVEVYYNSSQFRRTVERLEKFFGDAYRLYESLGNYYEEEGLFGRNHSRMGRLNILRDFALSVDQEHQKEYEQALILDLYAREKSKTRPDWALDLTPYKDEIYEFYRNESERRDYLKDGYEGMSRRQLLGETHLEPMDGFWYLVDYKKKDPLTGEGTVYQIFREEQRK